MSSTNNLLSDLIRWKETSELSFELTDVVYTLLDEMLRYCKNNNIPIHENKGLWNLVKKAKTIFKEIEIINSQNFKGSKLFNLVSDGILQREQSDEDFTEPLTRRELDQTSKATRSGQ